MTTFIGFNTIKQYKKFTLTGFDLIKRDLLNAFNIRPGQIPGRPAYGSVIWDYVFENQVEATQHGIQAEVQRVAGGDPRIYISSVQAFPQDNGILIQILLQVIPTNNSEILSIFFNQQTRRATYV
jgi:phage baseplate assembly protein W